MYLRTRLTRFLPQTFFPKLSPPVADTCIAPTTSSLVGLGCTGFIFLSQCTQTLLVPQRSSSSIESVLLHLWLVKLSFIINSSISKCFILVMVTVYPEPILIQFSDRFIFPFVTGSTCLVHFKHIYWLQEQNQSIRRAHFAFFVWKLLCY